jgi:hypothetical protein
MAGPDTTSTTSGMTALPRWLKPANRVIVLVQSLGLSMGPVHVISVPGRKSGRMRTTPVTPFSVDGRRYIASLGHTEWVRNARVAGWGVLARGRRRDGVRLVELGLEERTPILRQFPVLVPRGVGFFIKVGAVKPPAGPDAFAAAAPVLTVFRLDPAGG